MSNENQNDSNEYRLNSFIRSYSISKLLFSNDFKWAFICTNIIIALISYFVINFHSNQKVQIFLLEISEFICSNAIVINSSLLGIIVAAIAIFASFSRPELLAKFYKYKKDERRLHQYVLVLFFPAIPAIMGIFFAFLGNIFTIAENNSSIFLAWISLFFTFYCVFGVWESIIQIANSIITQAKNKNT